MRLCFWHGYGEYFLPHISPLADLFGRFNPESDTPVEIPGMCNPTTLLTNIIDRQISVSLVVSDRIFTSSEDAAKVIKLLSKSAVELNLYRIVSELGQAEAIGKAYVDPLEDVPEIQPVLRIKVSRLLLNT
jgi:DNA-directed RNA polymerase, mitochondrial